MDVACLICAGSKLKSTDPEYLKVRLCLYFKQALISKLKYFYYRKCAWPYSNFLSAEDKLK